ncbi:MAG: hypothetical protein FWE90_07440 [Defluviitaleaceae bacterium]|nr:hypothetical protein [Defluviitaleaceae bacterium]
MKKKKRGKNKSQTGEPMVDALAPDEIEMLDGEDEADETDGLDNNGSSHETLYKETLDRYTRTLAEFDNFRKRSIKEKPSNMTTGYAPSPKSSCLW